MRSWTHDAMTEAPGRKNDAHLSSVPGDEGRAAKIGEVFRRGSPYFLCVRTCGGRTNERTNENLVDADTSHTTYGDT